MFAATQKNFLARASRALTAKTKEDDSSTRDDDDSPSCGSDLHDDDGFAEFLQRRNCNSMGILGSRMHCAHTNGGDLTLHERMEICDPVQARMELFQQSLRGELGQPDFKFSMISGLGLSHTLGTLAESATASASCSSSIRQRSTTHENSTSSLGQDQRDASPCSTQASRISAGASVCHEFHMDTDAPAASAWTLMQAAPERPLACTGGDRILCF